MALAQWGSETKEVSEEFLKVGYKLSSTQCFNSLGGTAIDEKVPDSIIGKTDLGNEFI